MIMEKMMKILRRGWMYAIVAVFIISMSGCAEEKKADAPSTESPETEAVSPAVESAAPDAAESAASEAAEGVSADPKDASDAANPEAEPGVRDDIPVKGAK